MKIVLVGGGTGGSITPLLAIFQELKKDGQHDFLFIGGKSSLEKDFAEDNNISFQTIWAGKLRRYLDLRNFLSPLFILIGFVQSLKILLNFRPQVIIAAGSFIAVPVIWAGWILKIPALIHQQDIKKGLANSLTAPFAKRITVTFPTSLKDFSRKKTKLTGNPVRAEIFSGNQEKAYELFNLKRNLPVVLILGGGTGALAINKIVTKALSQLLFFCQVIHIAGKGKNVFQDDKLKESHRPPSVESITLENKENLISPKNLEYYHPYEFLSEELKHVLPAADLVVSRAGMSTLTELASLGKPTMIIPLPHTSQEENANYFEKNNAALVLNQESLTPEILTNIIHELLQNKVKQNQLSFNMRKLIIPDATNNVIKEIYEITKLKDGS